MLLVHHQGVNLLDSLGQPQQWSPSTCHHHITASLLAAHQQLLDVIARGLLIAGVWDGCLLTRWVQGSSAAAGCWKALHTMGAVHFSKPSILTPTVVAALTSAPQTAYRVGPVLQGCSSWRQSSLDWRIFLVLLCACSKDGREQHADGFLRILGPCVVPQSRCCLPPACHCSMPVFCFQYRARRVYWGHRHGGMGSLPAGMFN